MREVRLLVFVLILALLAGCGAASQAEIYDDAVPAASMTPSGGSFVPYRAPAFLDAQFHEALAQGEEGARIDVSAVTDGYVGVSAVSDRRLKFQVVVEGATTYNYNIASDGTPSVFPLQSGNGTYRFRIMENVAENRYAERFSVTCEVTLRDEFQPYLRPSDYVRYSPDSQCVRKAAEFAGQSADAMGVVAKIYEYICASVTYDTPKAQSVQSGYLPDPDETLRTGKGICFDYASLAAAMLRSQGIPAKVVFGYVSPDDLYHAWNMFYTAETGWVTVSYEVSARSWNRLDLTFTANGADDNFVGNGENYADLYFY